VYPAEFEYFSPETLDEALALLAQHGDDAKILAGGQSLMPMMKLRIASPRYLVDVNRIAALAGLRRVGEQLVMGALCRHADIVASPLVREHLPIMLDAANLTADVQVRNRGTVAGSLAHADPSGDWPAALLALETTVTIAGPTGIRVTPLGEFIVDAYTTQLGVNEMVTEVSVVIPPQPNGGAYVKFEKRAGDFAVASIGVQIELDEHERCRSAAVTLGALAPTPLRAPAVESLLHGKSLAGIVSDGGSDGGSDGVAYGASGEWLTEAERLIRETAEPFADTRGSVEYKLHLAGVLFRRALIVAVDRARGRKVATLRP
jgi:aerobic carbon-monoxide dehydrogenase medium subunit